MHDTIFSDKHDQIMNASYPVQILALGKNRNGKTGFGAKIKKLTTRSSLARDAEAGTGSKAAQAQFLKRRRA